MICMARRFSRILFMGRRVISSPSNRIVPAVGSVSRISRRPSVDLPQPDSPTSPSVSPVAMRNETPSTARNLPLAA